MNRADFENMIEQLFADARKNGQDYKTINSGDLHRKVGGYPGPDHRMPTCCDVMRNKMKKDSDKIITSPPKGNGASLTIEYKL